MKFQKAYLWNWRSLLLGILFVVILMFYWQMKQAPPVTSEESLDIASGYEKTSYKVVAFARNPFDDYSSTLTVVTKRDSTVNDSFCGSIYSPSDCYFFVESADFGIDPIRYVGSWHSGIAGIVPESVRFKNKHTVTFTASGADGGAGVSESWELNLRSGETTMVSKTVSEE